MFVNFSMICSVKTLLVLRYLLLVLIYLNIKTFLFSQSYSIKGQLWATGVSVENQPKIMSQLGYIPTVSAYNKLSHDSMVDLEWAYRFDRSFKGDSPEEHHDKLYRGWLRYSNQVIEARFGLQKISFGPARVLRPLAWFDTIDPEDPTDQTVGVEAFRLRFFPSNSLALWTWIMKSESNTLSYGGRGEVSTSLGEWGFTLHQAPDESNTQIGIDFRYDGFLGFWFESTGFFTEDQEILSEDRHSLMTLGADYTLPLGTGLLIMSETLRSEGWSSKTNATTSNQTISAFMISLPLGMFHHFMFISNLDWDENNSYNYLRWSSTYDSFSINCMTSINPNEMGNSLQLMLIYNH